MSRLGWFPSLMHLSFVMDHPRLRYVHLSIQPDLIFFPHFIQTMHFMEAWAFRDLSVTLLFCCHGDIFNCFIQAIIFPAGDLAKCCIARLLV